jgi:hypothetical protein
LDTKKAGVSISAFFVFIEKIFLKAASFLRDNIPVPLISRAV